MGMLNGVRTLNALTGGVMSSAQLTTHLAAGTNLGSFIQVLNSDSQARVLVESTTAMNAVAGSTTAMDLLLASSVAAPLAFASSRAVNAIAGVSAASNNVFTDNKYVGVLFDRLQVNGGGVSSPALVATKTVAEVAASSTFMNLIVARATSKMAVFNSDAVLSGFVASTTAINAMRTTAQYGTSNSFTTTTSAMTGATVAGSCIVVGAGCGNASGASAAVVLTVGTLRPGSNRPATCTGIAPTASSAAITIPLAIPLVAPFTMAKPEAVFTFNFGVLRCDI